MQYLRWSKVVGTFDKKKKKNPNYFLYSYLKFEFYKLEFQFCGVFFIYISM